MIDLDAILMLRAEEQVAAVTFGVRCSTPPDPKHDGPRMSARLCPVCKVRRLAFRNRSGICGPCWNSMSPRQREGVKAGVMPRRRLRKARPQDIERARARLAERGIAA